MVKTLLFIKERAIIGQPLKERALGRARVEAVATRKKIIIALQTRDLVNLLSNKTFLGPLASILMGLPRVVRAFTQLVLGNRK